MRQLIQDVLCFDNLDRQVYVRVVKRDDKGCVTGQKIVPIQRVSELQNGELCLMVEGRDLDDAQ